MGAVEKARRERARAEDRERDAEMDMLGNLTTVGFGWVGERWRGERGKGEREQQLRNNFRPTLHPLG